MSRERFIAAVTTYRTARHVARVERENILRRSVVVIMLHVLLFETGLEAYGGRSARRLSVGRSAVGQSIACATWRLPQTSTSKSDTFFYVENEDTSNMISIAGLQQQSKASHCHAM